MIKNEGFNKVKAEEAVNNVKAIFSVEDMKLSSEEEILAQEFLEGKMSKEEFENRYKAAK